MSQQATARTDWRMHLNNYMEVNGGTKLIAYEYESSGERDNELTWSCRVFVREILCGVGVGPRKAFAAEIAAERALLQLSPKAHAVVLSTMS